jgi:micrococcal nuclease
VIPYSVREVSYSSSPPQFSQYATVDDIPADFFVEHKSIYGRVERVIDGDTIRISHCPTYFICPERDSKKLYDSTIKVRMYGVDSPELQKKKSDPPSQPFAKEAKDFTSALTLDKTVELKLLKKDQYGRAISKVQAGSLDVSLGLVQKGLATMYRGKGAEYDGNKQLLESLQITAQQNKVGIWSLGDEMMSPAEFKRQQRQTEVK